MPRFFHLRLNLGVDFLELIVQLRELRIRGTELGVQVGDLNLHIRLLGEKAVQQPEADCDAAAAAAGEAAGAGSDRVRIAGLA